MAKTYAEKNALSIANTGKSLYAIRQEKGQGRGHHPGEKNTPPLIGKPRSTSVKPTTATATATATTAQKPASHKPPKIEKRVIPLPGKGNGRIVSTYSPNLIHRYATAASQRGHGEQRIYFELYNKRTDAWIKVYHGNRQTAHGMTANFFLDKVEERIESGKADNVGEAIRQVLSEDAGQDDSPTDEDTEIDPVDITQIRMYVMPLR
jgi:hypothetical protein